MFALALALVLLIMVVGLVGNLLVLVVIALDKQMQESTSLFICNLALADLLFLSFCVPLTAFSYLSNSFPFPEHFCYFTVILQYATCYVSVWTLVLLAHDRFVSITSPAVGLRRTRTVYWICLAVWCIVLALNSLQLRHVGVLHFEYNGTSGSACVDSLEIAWGRASQTQVRLFYWGFNFGAYLLPLAMSCIFYFLLVKEIWRQKLVRTKSSQKMKRHATRMVFIVILTFGACWLPQNIRFFLRGLNYPDASFWEQDEQTLLLVQSIAQTLAYANSCVNPIIYGLMSERFRMAFWRTLSLLCCRRVTAVRGGHRPLTGSAGNLSLAPRTPPLSSFHLLNGHPRRSFPTTATTNTGEYHQKMAMTRTMSAKVGGCRTNENAVTEWRSPPSITPNRVTTETILPDNDRRRSATIVMSLPSMSTQHNTIPSKNMFLGAEDEEEDEDDEVILL